jgi:Fungal trichothecene efflux pump (TRI12)
VIGGAFTDSATWRWCFYINLPIGAVTFVTLLMFFHPGNQKGPAETFVSKILKLDIVGNFLIVTTVTMLLLALEWGGVSHAWNSPTIIGLLVGTSIEFLIFIAWQKYRGLAALIPLSIVSQRTVASSFAAGFFLSGATLVHAYYIPYWFQAIKGDSAIGSGVNLIPYLASNFFFVLLTGVVAMKTGYVNPPALLGPIPATIGSGLLTTLSRDISTAKWAGYQVLAAAGIGMSIQQGIVAVQAVLPEATVPIGTALVVFAQSLSGAIFISAGNNLLRSDLTNGLMAARLPGVDVAAVLAAGTTELRRLVPVEQLIPVLEIYNSALMKVMILAVPLAGLGLVSAVPMEWVSLRGKTVVGGE